MKAVDRERVVSLARIAVRTLAPEELAVFEVVSHRCARDPERGLGIGRIREDVLGFGIDVAVPLLTPVAVAVAAEAIRYIALRLPSKLSNLKGNSEKGQAPLPQLTTAELRDVHAIAYQKALASKLSEPRATALADALVAGLVMAPD